MIKATKENLDKIHWKRISVFKEDDTHLLVLECGNQQESVDFFEILSENEFRFTIEQSNNGLPSFVITFIESKLRAVIIPGNDSLFKYFVNKQVTVITTGFQYGDGNDVAYLDGRIKMGDLHYPELN